MNNAKKNFMYNAIYQILILILPLITAPYLSRIVGVDGVGVYSYTYSIVYYFMLLTLLGVNNYGNRRIAKVRDNKKELSETFWGIYLFQLFMGILMLIFYIVYLHYFNVQYKEIAKIQLIFILSSILDINWLFFGLEEFKKTITRNTIIKFSTVILIFIFVRNENDLWIYTLIMASMTCIGQIILWGFIRKRIVFIKINIRDITKHIKPNLILFIPVIAISLYKMMDKIMLGSITSVIEVGYYENAEKIINIPMTLITALGTVMLPRISNFVSKGEKEKISDYIDKSINFIMFMSFAMSFGLMAIGYKFAPVFFGEQFQKTGILIIMLSVTLPILSFANVIRTQYLIPFEKDKIYIKSVSIGAVTNLIINFILIPKFSSIGACIGTIFAEFAVMFYQILKVKNELTVCKYIRESINFLIKAIIMYICIIPLNYLNISSIYIIVSQVFLGGIIYVLLNIKYISSIINLKNVPFISKILNRQ